MAPSFTTGRTRSVNQLLGLGFGAVYLLVGLVGFAITGGVEFAGRDGAALLGIFDVNPLHNIVHLGVGALLIAGGLGGATSARAVNTLVGAVYLLVGLAGLVIVDSAVNILALNTPDNLLHLASAALLLGVGVGVRR